MKEELFRLEYVNVHYKNSLILRQFSMELYKGEVLGIYTKNFSEADCLIATLYGDIKPDSGRILFNGIPLNSMENINDIKTVVISKRSQLVENFSVAENIFIIRKGFKKHYISKKKLEFQTVVMLKKLGLEINAEALISTLSKLEKILVEISKAFILRIPVVIFKNLSSYLSDKDIKKLYNYLDILKKVGLTFVVIDSTGTLLEAYCNRVILLNRGSNIWTFRSGEFKDSILSNFFKIDRDKVINHHKVSGENTDCLELKELATDKLNILNLKLYKGEVLGLIDLEGVQIDELKSILLDRIKFRGEISINGVNTTNIKAYKVLKKGLAVIDEDPSETTLFSGLSGIDNLSFPLSSKVPLFWQKKKYRNNIVKKYEPYFSKVALTKSLKHLDVKDLHTLAYLKWHLYSPDYIVLIKPFSSVDRQLEDLTITLIDLLIQKGIGIIILTSNLWELSRLSSKQNITIQRLTPLT